MDFFDVLKTRHSIRAFAATPVANEKLQAILSAANVAPSAGNLQSYEIYVARRASHGPALAEATLNQGFVAQAPIALIFRTHAARAVENTGTRRRVVFSTRRANRMHVCDVRGNDLRSGGRLDWRF